MQKSAMDGLVYKTHAQTEQAPAQAGQADQEWNVWLEAALEQRDEILHAAIGEFVARRVSKLEREMRREFATQIAELKGQVATLLTLFAGAKGSDVVDMPRRRHGA